LTPKTVYSFLFSFFFHPLFMNLKIIIFSLIRVHIFLLFHFNFFLAFLTFFRGFIIKVHFLLSLNFHPCACNDDDDDDAHTLTHEKSVFSLFFLRSRSLSLSRGEILFSICCCCCSKIYARFSHIFFYQRKFFCSPVCVNVYYILIKIVKGGGGGVFVVVIEG
jgi:hypothetical protein